MAFSVSSAARRWFRSRSKSEALDPPGDSRDPSNKNNFRVVVFGPTAVGKTCIVTRLMGKNLSTRNTKRPWKSCTVASTNSTERELPLIYSTLPVRTSFRRCVGWQCPRESVHSLFTISATSVRSKKSENFIN